MFCYNSSVRISATGTGKQRRVHLQAPPSIRSILSDLSSNQTTQTWKSSHSCDETTKLIVLLTNPPHVHIYHPGWTLTYSLNETIDWLGLCLPLMSLPSSRAHTVNPVPAAPLPPLSFPTRHRKPLWNDTFKCQKALERRNWTQYKLKKKKKLRSYKNNNNNNNCWKLFLC